MLACPALRCVLTSLTSCLPSFNGWGVTAVDSLDTMLLMGLEDEYTRALPIISQSNFSLPTVRSLLCTHLQFIQHQRTFLESSCPLF